MNKSTILKVLLLAYYALDTANCDRRKENDRLFDSDEDFINDIITEEALNEDGDDDYIERHLPIRPGELLEPIQDKIDKISAYLTHPNVGVLFRPYEFLVKLRKTGANFFNNFNDAVFGAGQTGGHDYPFPYRSLEERKSESRREEGEEEKRPAGYLFPYLIPESVWKNMTM